MAELMYCLPCHVDHADQYLVSVNLPVELIRQDARQNRFDFIRLLLIHGLDNGSFPG